MNSVDHIFGKKISIQQPMKGYRVAIDPILLANFVSIKKADDTVLDVGCGVGAISLVLKYKNPNIKITGIDIDAEMCDLCKKNALQNSLDIDVINIDIKGTHEDSVLKKQLFDHVVTNPPFFETKSSRISQAKLMANFETVALDTWITLCLKKLKNRGTFSIIHCASRLHDILFSIKEKAGSIEIIPIYSKANRSASRVIIKCVKESNASVTVHPSMVIHDDCGKYKENVSEILSGKLL